MKNFFCKKKGIVVHRLKAYAVCLIVGCPELITVKSKRHLKKLKKKYAKIH